MSQIVGSISADCQSPERLDVEHAPAAADDPGHVDLGRQLRRLARWAMSNEVPDDPCCRVDGHEDVTTSSTGRRRKLLSIPFLSSAILDGDVQEVRCARTSSPRRDRDPRLLARRGWRNVAFVT